MSTTHLVQLRRFSLRSHHDMNAQPPPYYPPEVDVLSQQRLELESALQAQQQPAGVINLGPVTRSSQVTRALGTPRALVEPGYAHAVITTYTRKKLGNRTKHQVEYKLETLERKMPHFADEFESAREELGLGRSRVLKKLRPPPPPPYPVIRQCGCVCTCGAESSRIDVEVRGRGDSVSSTLTAASTQSTLSALSTQSSEMSSDHHFHQH